MLHTQYVSSHNAGLPSTCKDDLGLGGCVLTLTDDDRICKIASKDGRSRQSHLDADQWNALQVRAAAESVLWQSRASIGNGLDLSIEESIGALMYAKTCCRISPLWSTCSILV